MRDGITREEIQELAKSVNKLGSEAFTDYEQLDIDLSDSDLKKRIKKYLKEEICKEDKPTFTEENIKTIEKLGFVFEELPCISDRENDQKKKVVLDEEKVVEEKTEEKLEKKSAKVELKSQEQNIIKDTKKRKKDYSSCSKSKIWRSWVDSNKTKNAHDLHKEINETVKISTVKSWINSWKKGNNLPFANKV